MVGVPHREDALVPRLRLHLIPRQNLVGEVGVIRERELLVKAEFPEEENNQNEDDDEWPSVKQIELHGRTARERPL